MAITLTAKQILELAKYVGIPVDEKQIEDDLHYEEDWTQQEISLYANCDGREFDDGEGNISLSHLWFHGDGMEAHEAIPID